MTDSPDRDAASVHSLPELGVVLVAAGRGERLGHARPKAFVELGGVSLIAHCVETIASLPHPGHLVIVVPSGEAQSALDIVDGILGPGGRWEASVVAGGRERHESVRFGLAALHESVETVLIHDAARPLASREVFERVLAEVRRTGAGVVPGVEVVDTLKRVDATGRVIETVDRGALRAVQTPQGFPREAISAAHETMQLQSDVSPTDDAEVLQRAGGSVSIVSGESRALKLTTPHDLRTLEWFLSDFDPSESTR